MYYLQTLLIVWYILKRGGRSQNLGWNVYFNNVDWHYNYHENGKIKMIIISLIYITNRERNIIHKVQISCYNKYTVNRCSGNNEITYFTTSTGTTNVNDFSQADQNILEMEYELFTKDYLKLLFMKIQKLRQNYDFCSLSFVT
jgi:hypothetical protein